MYHLVPLRPGSPNCGTKRQKSNRNSRKTQHRKKRNEIYGKKIPEISKRRQKNSKDVRRRPIQRTGQEIVGKTRCRGSQNDKRPTSIRQRQNSMAIKHRAKVYQKKRNKIDKSSIRHQNQEIHATI